MLLVCNAIAFAQQPLDSRLAVLDPIVNDAIAQQQIPGAVLMVGTMGKSFTAKHLEGGRWFRGARR